MVGGACANVMSRIGGERVVGLSNTLLESQASVNMPGEQIVRC